MVTDRFQAAFDYACIAHGGQTRKGGDIPYIAHLMEVASIVLAHGIVEDEAIGALLHDAAEEAGGIDRLEDIRARFGNDVAEIVQGSTDTFQDPKPPWLARKRAYIARLAEGRVRSPSALLVSAADKLSNVRAILHDYREQGDEIWARFSGDKAGTLWYYRTLADLFERLLIDDLACLARDLRRAVDDLQREAGMEGPLDAPAL